MSAESKSELPYGPSRLPWAEQVPPYAEVQGPSGPSPYPRIPPPNVDKGFPRIDYRMFEVPPTGLSEAEHANALAAFRDFAELQHERFTGYQTNMNQKYSSRLSWLLDMHTNSVGDPFSSGWFTLNTKFLERACLDYFAALWNVKWPHVELTRDQITQATTEELEEVRSRYWGWVLSMGSTEANLYALFNARDYLKGLELKEERDPDSGEVCRVMNVPADSDKKAPPSYYKPIIFYSEDSHYSVIKCVRMLELTGFQKEAWLNREAEKKKAKEEKREDPCKWVCPLKGYDKDDLWPEDVPSHKDGSIKIKDLELMIRPFLKAGYPIILVLNLGSTWKGAYDDVGKISDILKDLKKPTIEFPKGEFPELWKRDKVYGKPEEGQRRGFWLHVDGALGAGYLPFLEMARNEHGWKEDAPPLPRFDFREEAVMSICASTHKWPGAPWAGSVYMTKTEYQLFPPSNPSYIGAADTTLGGSRNAMTAALLWDYLARTSYEDSMQAAIKAEDAARFFEQKLRSLEQDLKRDFPALKDEIDLWVERSELSLAVRFRLVTPTLVYKYSIDRERLAVKVSKDEQEERTYCHVYFMQSVTKELARQLIEDIRALCKDGWREAFPAEDWDTKEPNPGPRKPIEKKKHVPGTMSLPPGQGFGCAGARPGALISETRRVAVTAG